MKTLLAILLCISLIAPAAFAANYAYGECPRGYSCEASPDGAVPPDAVTGHTIYAKWVMERTSVKTLGLPTDFAAIAGYFAIVDTDLQAVQRECVTWFDGHNVDQRPDPDANGWGGGNHFPSDEDDTRHAGAAQDYDFDRDVRNCVPRVRLDQAFTYEHFAVAVERGDCAPHLGRDFRFRGHLDFVDPNNIYHEVQEYDYTCGSGLGRDERIDLEGPLADDLERALDRTPHGHLSDAAKQLFPRAGTDRHNQAGCKVYATPANNTDPVNGSVGHFDLGHKCNGSVQELFTERMWITRMHVPVWDPTIQDEYNFALQIDTCSGVNVHERRGKDAMGDENAYANASRLPARPLDELGQYAPLVDQCTDGSSWSFDDTPRGRTVHQGPPADEKEIMRGNSYGYNGSHEDTFGKHRAQCRDDAIRWPYNAHATAGIGDCYPEDHKTAQVDLYVYSTDPTRGRWFANTNEMTGPNAYTGHDHD